MTEYVLFYQFMSSASPPLVQFHLNMLGVIFSCLLISASDGLQLKVPDSPVTCSNEGVECEYDEDNLIDAVMNVPTLEECRQICLDRDYCSYTTYFYDSASPVPSFCLLFKTCETTNTCSDCMSENMDCFKMCGRNVVGDLRENVQDIILKRKKILHPFTEHYSIEILNFLLFLCI